MSKIGKSTNVTLPVVVAYLDVPLGLLGYKWLGSMAYFTCLKMAYIRVVITHVLAFY